MDDEDGSDSGLVARCNSAEFLEFAEKVFDQMLPFLHREVAIGRSRSIGLGRNDGDSAPVVEGGAQPIVVKGFAAEQRSYREIRNQRFDADAVMSPARQQDEAREIAKRIDEREYFGQAARDRPEFVGHAYTPLCSWP